MIDIPPKLWVPSKPAIIRASRLPDPVDLRRGVFAPGFMGKKPVVKPTLALRNSTTSTATTVAKPAGCVAGDILVIANVAYTSATSTIPPAVTPTGFTILSNAGANYTADSIAIRLMMTWRIANGSEGSTFTGMSSGQARYLVCLCFSGGVTSVAPSTALSQITDNFTAPSSQTIVTSEADAPIIALAMVGGSGASGQNASMSPIQDGTPSSPISSTRMVLVYKIFNSSPVDVTASTTSASHLEGLQSGYLAAA